jgi:ribosomal protein S12 methylthiotransferase accessory factor
LRLRHDVNDYAAQRLLSTLVPTVDARDRHSEATRTFEDDTLLAIEKLRHAGMDHVIVFDLNRPDFPIHVVKVIVPGLEGYMFDFYTPGRRARSFSAVEGV